MKPLKTTLALWEAVGSHKSWSNLPEYVAHNDQRIPHQTHTLWTTAENICALAPRYQTPGRHPKGLPSAAEYLLTLSVTESAGTDCLAPAFLQNCSAELVHYWQPGVQLKKFMSSQYLPFFKTRNTPACKWVNQKSEMGWRRCSSLMMTFSHALATEKRYSPCRVKCKVLGVFSSYWAPLKQGCSVPHSISYQARPLTPIELRNTSWCSCRTRQWKIKLPVNWNMSLLSWLQAKDELWQK